MPEPEETPALSPSIAHVLTTESALHAWTIHRLLGALPRPTSDAQEKGHIFHALILEGGKGLRVIDATSYRSRLAKDARDEARELGEIPVLASKLDDYQLAADRIREQIAAFGFDLDDGVAEQRLEWAETTDAGDIRCSGRADWIRTDRQLVIDLKTTDGSAHPDACAGKLLREPGVIQDTAYRRAVAFADMALAGRVEVVFLFAQTVEPYAVTPAFCGGSMREIGALRWARAMEIWGRCMARGRARKHWPSYAHMPVQIEAPGWAVAREMGEE